MVHLTFFIGQLACSVTGSSIDHCRRHYFRIARLACLVQEEVDECALQLCAFAFVYGEAGTGNLDTQVKVYQVVFLGQFPVWKRIFGKFGFHTAHFFHHIARFSNPCGIDDFNGNPVNIEVFLNGIPRCAGDIGHNRTILLQQPVQQRGFPDIRLADNDSLNRLTDGMHDYASLALCGDKLIAKRHSMSMGDEIYAVNNTRNGNAFAEAEQLTFENKQIYDQLEMGKVEARWMTTTDGKQMLTWVIYPPQFDPNKKYPTLLYCQGGPQSVVSQFWSYRWNFQLMAAQGYVVVAPNRRGLPSFGQEWLDQISGDYAGQNICDYLSAIDDVAGEPWADETRMGCVGASYGGYSVFFLAGCHEKRFKAFIAHCGIFNFESMYGETEELFFINNDYGGPYWDRSNQVAQRSYANSPHKFVDKWDTPILIFTGEYDFRIPYTQSLEAFTAARVRGIPARLVEFENEAHQVFRPQNSLVWNREFFGWLDKYVK